MSGRPGSSRAVVRSGGATARRLRIAAEAGDPVHVTLRELRDIERLPHHTVVVCENPRLLEAVADRFGGEVPVVGTAGQPRLVTLDLLRRLAGTDAVPRYHGNLDWPGIAIANRPIAEAAVTPWLMMAADHEAAVRQGSALIELGGTPDPASWDPSLSLAMCQLGVAVHEEAVLGELLARLVADPQVRAGSGQSRRPNRRGKRNKPGITSRSSP